MLYRLSYSRPKRCSGRDGRIRTADPLLPKQVRYQAAPRPGAEQVYRTHEVLTPCDAWGRDSGTAREALPCPALQAERPYSAR